MTTGIEKTEFDLAAESVIAAGNVMLDDENPPDIWEVGSGLLAGAIQFWLYTRQPCDDPMCEACAQVSTAQRRLKILLEEARELAEDSDYFNSPQDLTVGNA